MILVFLPGYKKWERREGNRIEKSNRKIRKMRCVEDSETKKSSSASERSDVHEFFMY